ncbi:UNVERIFIED_CONTAM: hypothetical protein BEN50_25725 [Euhalothece sp. KZN 001]
MPSTTFVNPERDELAPTPGCPNCAGRDRACYICDHVHAEQERARRVAEIEAHNATLNLLPLDHSANTDAGDGLAAWLAARGD